MSEKAPLVPHIVVLEEESTTPLTTVSIGISVASSLSPQEIERICKAFIRLLHAPLIQGREKRSNDRRIVKKKKLETGVSSRTATDPTRWDVV